jgi:hypothetical protein
MKTELYEVGSPVKMVGVGLHKSLPVNEGARA